MGRVKSSWFFEGCTPKPRYACDADGATVPPNWRITGQAVHVICSTNSQTHFTRLPATCFSILSVCVFQLCFFVVCWSLRCALMCSEVWLSLWRDVFSCWVSNPQLPLWRQPRTYRQQVQCMATGGFFEHASRRHIPQSRWAWWLLIDRGAARLLGAPRGTRCR